MKTHTQLVALLTPGQTDNMPEKWRAAWTLLDEDQTVPEVFRCHARCWLTSQAAHSFTPRDMKKASSLADIFSDTSLLNVWN